jgi:hypothetical protein
MKRPKQTIKVPALMEFLILRAYFGVKKKATQKKLKEAFLTDMRLNFVTGIVLKATDNFCFKTERDFRNWKKSDIYSMLQREVDNRKECTKEL